MFLPENYGIEFTKEAIFVIPMIFGTTGSAFSEVNFVVESEGIHGVECGGDVCDERNYKVVIRFKNGALGADGVLLSTSHWR